MHTCARTSELGWDDAFWPCYVESMCRWCGKNLRTGAWEAFFSHWQRGQASHSKSQTTEVFWCFWLTFVALLCHVSRGISDEQSTWRRYTSAAHILRLHKSLWNAIRHPNLRDKMKIKYAAMIALLASTLPHLISAIVPPGASTPLFYLVSTTSISLGTLNFLVSPPIPQGRALFVHSHSPKLVQFQL